MTLVPVVSIGLLTALAARSLFPGSRFFGVSGMLSAAMAGSSIGGLIAVVMHPAQQWFAFEPFDIAWSTLGAVVVLAGVVVSRRSDLARVEQSNEHQ